MGELTKLKITNPFWLGQIGPFLSEFLKKVSVPGVTYESLYTHFANTVQHGAVALDQNVRDNAELWVVFEENEAGNNPIAFGHWFTKGPPFIGTVFCDFIYSWQRKKEPAGLLYDEFLKFGVDHRAKIWEAVAANDAVFKVLSRAASQRGLKVYPQNWKHFVMVQNENLPQDQD